jgi:hypothetical protein
MTPAIIIRLLFSYYLVLAAAACMRHAAAALSLPLVFIHH